MAAEFPEKYFSEGMEFLKAENLEKAARAFEKAYKTDKENPKYMSYYGMCVALRWSEIGLGLELCTKAVKREFHMVEYYLNLAKVYMKANNKKGATVVLKKGLKFDPEHAVINEELIKLGDRRGPIISSLSRSNPINKILGILVRRTIPNLIARFRMRGNDDGKEDSRA